MRRRRPKRYRTTRLRFTDAQAAAMFAPILRRLVRG